MSRPTLRDQSLPSLAKPRQKARFPRDQCWPISSSQDPYRSCILPLQFTGCLLHPFSVPAFFIGTVNSNSGLGGTVSKQFASWFELLLLRRKHMHFNLCCINYALGSFGSCSALSLRRLIWLIQQSFGLCHDHLLLGPGAILNSLCWLCLESAVILWQFARKVLLPESGAWSNAAVKFRQELAKRDQKVLSL